MAFERKEQNDLDGLGPRGIIREALKLLTTHSKFFVLIQLTLLLPLAALAVTCEHYFYWALYKDDRTPDSNSHQFHAVDFSVFLRYGAFGFDQGFTWIVVLLIMAGFEIILTPFLSIPSSAIIYSVALHFKGQRVSFWDTLIASIPRLCERLTMTMLYKTFLTYSLLILALLSIALLDGIPLTILVLWIVPSAALVLVGMVCLDIIFRLAAGVSVLDREFGWGALCRSWNLLKEREIVAIWFQLLWLGTTIILLGFQFIFRYHIARWGTPPWSLGLVYTALMAFLWQMNALVSGIQYAVFKAYHEESLPESIYEGLTMRGEYELVRSNDSDGIGQRSPKFFQQFGATTVFIID